MARRRTVIDREPIEEVKRIAQAFAVARKHAVVCTKCEQEIVNDFGEPGDLNKACAEGIELLQRYVTALELAAAVGGNPRKSSSIRKFLHGLIHKHWPTPKPQRSEKDELQEKQNQKQERKETR